MANKLRYCYFISHLSIEYYRVQLVISVGALPEEIDIKGQYIKEERSLSLITSRYDKS